jgi:LPS-assembly protein
VLAVLIAGISPAAWSAGLQNEAPVNIEADSGLVESGKSAEVKGRVVIEQGDLKLESDWARYQQQEDRVEAGDNFTMTREGNTLSGTKVQMTLGARQGEIADPVFVMAGERARGDARKLLLEGPDRYALTDGRFTTCPVGNNDWYIHSSRLNLDYDRQIGEAWGSWLEFKGTPVFYYPWIDFPLDGRRKSGMLVPTFSFDNSAGFSVATPVYWNIAPNYDATVTPRYFTKRGTMLGGEFRYLTEDMNGLLRAEILDDQLDGRSRYSEMFKHTQKLAPNLQLALNLQKVSDDNYLKDFGDRMAVSSQTNLPREGVLSYAGHNWSSYLRWQRFQTLQSSSDPVDVPYARMPQLFVDAKPEVASWLQPTISAETARFEHASKTSGTRTWAYPALALPFQDTYGFFTPKVGVHATRYTLEDKNSGGVVTGKRDQNRTLPIFTLDSGLYFERETASGEGVQTLEPRAYFVRIPYRDQTALPVFDSGETDLSFSQMFSENQFSGQDRINDANQLTLALTSRQLRRETGMETFRATVGQRFYMSPQRVTLPSTCTDSSSCSSSTASTAGERRSDSLLSLGAQLWRDVEAEYDLQYSFKNDQARRSAVQLSWQPDDFKRLNLRYTLNRISGIEQLDFSGQWPIANSWYALGRENYSLRDKRTLEALLGVEYNAGCWGLRLAAQRYVTTDLSYSSRYFLTLELGGIAGLGNNPLETIKQAIPGYTDTYNQPSLTKSTP